MRIAHLFAGAGGGLLADLILGHRPVLAVESNRSCCRSLHARRGEGWLPADLHIHCGDIREFDFGPWAGRVDCITAGFPCQDISIAGQGKGIEGERSGLVWQVFRAIDALRPGVVFLENSPEIRTKGRRDIIGALVERGYSWKDGTLAAAAVGAAHIRNRWWLLAANANGKRQLEQERIERDERGWAGDKIADAASIELWKNAAARDNHKGDDAGRKEKNGRDGSSLEDDADDLRQRLQIAVQRGGLSSASAETIQAAARYTAAYHWSPPDAGICGMVYGISSEMDGCTKGDRVEACGNAQVPLQAAAAWIILSEGMAA